MGIPFSFILILVQIVSITTIFPIFGQGKDKPITPYIIYRAESRAGFWSNFLVILNGIDEADRKGWVPVVDMERHRTNYNENEPVLNTMNAWEYCFEQPGGISLQKALMLDFVDHGSIKVPFSRARAVRPSNDKMKRAKVLIKKYVKVKKSILDELDILIEPGLHNEILGVHVRGTDRRQGIYSKHALTADTNVYLRQAIDLDQINQFSWIYLACDEFETVDIFKAAFGERLMVSDAYRVSASLMTTTDHNWLFKADRPLHRYRLAREVLIDALLLARCGHLLCGPSNVSQAAMYFADGQQVVHEVASPGMTP